MMMPVETPKANPENLLDLIKDAHQAKVVLPEFQRSFVWGRQDIEEFLTSILQGYFVGTFLMLDTPSVEPLFPFRTVEGLESVNGQVRPTDNPTVRLVLDGQQRITSVFYALHAPEIPIRNASHPYRFFLLIENALDGNLDESIVGLSTWDRRRMSEMKALVGEHRALPFTLLQDSSKFYHWLYQEQTAWEGDKKKAVEALYERFQKAMVPVVALAARSGKENIVNIFERINRTGVSLSLFDLLAARLYIKGIRLRDLWKEFRREHQAVAQIIKPEFLLKVIVLLGGKEPRKRNMLDILDQMDVEHFLERWRHATTAMGSAHRRAAREYGVFDKKWLPYTTLLVPLAALLHELQAKGATADSYRKVDRWYWSNVFGQRYDSGVDTKSYQDLRDVLSWIDGGTAPEWLQKTAGQQVDLMVDEPRSAVYRGVICLIAKRGARDFLTGQPAELHNCDDDHMFPRLFRNQCG